jgi:hypothetical protein
MAILRNTTFSETGGFLSLPAGTTAQRPGLYSSATIVQLTTVGTSTWNVPAGVTTIEVLLVAGGGGGGFQVGGGGGGGGVVYRPFYPVTPGANITYTIGNGGTGAANAGVAATGGQDTTFGSGGEQVVAKGGGAGANHSTGVGGYDGLGQSGGSGGGGAGDSSSRSRRGGYPVDGQGYAGGRGRGGNHPDFSGNGWAGGGGGGAGGLGQDSTRNGQGGNGGAGITTNITWNGTGAQTLTNYGGGGGGCSGPASAGHRAGGGIGGGGSGAGDGDSGAPKNGVANTGGGGGGVRDTSGAAGNGGSGIIIIRYFADRQPLMSGSVRLNTDTGRVEQFQSNGVWGEVAIPFLTRQIITTAYMQGGYKDSAAWNNVNRTSVATDVTINLGDNSIERSFNYQGGACSTNLAYVFGAGNGHAINSNYVIAFNMRTEQAYNPGSGFSRTMAGSRWTFGTIFKETYLAWSAGGGDARLEEYNMTTQTLVGTVATVRRSGTAWGMSHENFGYIYWENDQDRLDFATRTLQSAGYRNGVSNHDQQKSIQSKYMWCWAGNEGSYNGGNSLRRTNMQTDTTMGTYSKPVGNSGEENFTLGQDWQYMIGMYNGAQNNISWKWYYYTETGIQGGSSMEPKDKGGASSGTCAWRD